VNAVICFPDGPDVWQGCFQLMLILVPKQSHIEISHLLVVCRLNLDPGDKAIVQMATTNAE